MFKYSIKTMGCKANLYDSLVLERELIDLGGVRDDQLPDLCIVNSCTVTAEADKATHREVRILKKNAPHALSVVTGCYAQVGKDKIEQDPHVSFVLKNDEKGSLQKLVADHFGLPVEHKQDPLNDGEIFWGQLPVALKGSGKRARAFLKIQEGCNDYCTYCIIPYARGKSRSVRLAMVLGEVQRLADEGIHELVLTGTNIADYGQEYGLTLEDLLEAIIVHTTMPRIRLTSLDPTEITDRLLSMMPRGANREWQNARVMPHLHVSLQSPVSRVLRLMKRHYRTEDVISCLNKIYTHNPDTFVGMDVIAGFPTETDEEQQEGLQILREMPWTRLHVFPYSEREGTPATRIPQVGLPSADVGVRRRRAQQLSALSHQRHEAFVQKILNTMVNGVLLESVHQESGDRFVAVGHSMNYLRFMVDLPVNSLDLAKSYENRICSVTAISAHPKPQQDWTIEGRLV